MKRSQQYVAFRHARHQLLARAKFELNRLHARFNRNRSNATFIAITGSSAKTTTSALLAHLLSGMEETHVQALDNELRDCISTLRTMSRHNRFVVCEVGATKPGSVKPMVDLLKPSIGIVTMVALEHKSSFRTCEAVQEDKQTLVSGLPDYGLAILNYDDSRVLSMASLTRARVKTFGETGGDYVISNVCAQNPRGTTLTISHAGEAVQLKTQLTGAHQSVPVAAAFACARELGVPTVVCQERIASFKPVFGRCSVHAIDNGPIFIADTAKAPYH
ncbi:MAG: Mur ligase family protein, partial [Hyphomicrobiaceae bacterium]